MNVSTEGSHVRYRVYVHGMEILGCKSDHVHMVVHSMTYTLSVSKTLYNVCCRTLLMVSKLINYPEFFEISKVACYFH